jgi:alpha-L-fucosidase
LSINEPGIKGFPHWEWTHGANKPSDAYIKKFRNRIVQLINDYHPDLLYFDDNISPLDGISNVGMEIISHFYNRNMLMHYGQMQGVINTKKLDESQRGSVVWDVERGHSNIIEPHPWQTDTCIGGWHYNKSIYDKNEYKTPTTVIHTLLDVISKNGNLLLNIPLRGDGTPDEKELKTVAGITDWMQQFSDCVYDTRPWKVYGEGPAMQAITKLEGHGFNEGKTKFTGEDIRFVTKGNALYANVLGSPVDGKLEIISLKKESELYPNTVNKVTLVSTKQDLTFQRTDKGLVINTPDSIKDNFAYSVKIV